MKEEELSNAMEKFKIEELGPRLEMRQWSAGTDTTLCVDEDGDYVTTYNATYTIYF